MKNSNQTFKKGYGKFPYLIDRISAGIYRQIPIVFTHEEDYTNIIGFRLNIPKSQLIINSEDLIYIYKSSLINLTKEYKKYLEKRDLKEKRICLVISPKEGIFFEPSNEIKYLNSIPSGGWLLGIDKEKVTEGNLHYKIEENYTKKIDRNHPSWAHINATDKEKLNIISKNPYRFYITERIWLPRGYSRINWLKKMLEKSIQEENYKRCEKIKKIINKIKISY